MLTYAEVINYFAKRYEYSNYLEIGVRGRETFDAVEIPVKYGVDPVFIPGDNMFQMTSDEFFNRDEEKSSLYSCIFIDGLHEKEQVLRDVFSSLKRLRSNGLIICDDIAVLAENGDGPELLSPYYCDNAWEAWAELGKYANISQHQIKGTRFGIIRKNFQIPHGLEIKPTYEFLQENKAALMRQIDWRDIDKVLNFESEKGTSWT